MKAGGAPTEAKSMFMSSGGTRDLMGNRAAENVTKGTRRQEPAYAAAWVGVPSCSGSSSGILHQHHDADNLTVLGTADPHRVGAVTGRRESRELAAGSLVAGALREHGTVVDVLVPVRSDSPGSAPVRRAR